MASVLFLYRVRDLSLCPGEEQRPCHPAVYRKTIDNIAESEKDALKGKRIAVKNPEKPSMV
jgi:hypothetical protein